MLVLLVIIFGALASAVLTSTMCVATCILTSRGGNLRFGTRPISVLKPVKGGVSEARISLTGFPLPLRLPDSEGNGSPSLASQVARRIARLDPENTFCGLYGPMPTQVLGEIPEAERGRPVEIAFAVGGAGAQLALSNVFLSRLRDFVLCDRFHVHLVAGTRTDVADEFLQQLRRSGLASRLGSGVSILYASNFATYYREFNRLLAKADILWTKPAS